MQDMNRRSFLGLGAALVSGAAIAGMAGCAPSVSSSSDDEKNTEGNLATTGSSTYAERTSGVERFAIAPRKSIRFGRAR